MPNTNSSAIAKLSAADLSTRRAAAYEIYREGRAAADRAVAQWWDEEELAMLMLAPNPEVTVGVAVPRETFARIHVANGAPTLARVPPDQDAEEFALHFGQIHLDVLTTRDPTGGGAIARYLTKFGEGIQQVEFRCLNVDRAMQILQERFHFSPVYPKARPGADGSTINFVLVPVAESSTSQSPNTTTKVLIELYEPAN